MRHRIVIDPKRWLEDALRSDTSISYFGVGKASKAAEPGVPV
jgi:hypothetical protein